MNSPAPDPAPDPLPDPLPDQAQAPASLPASLWRGALVGACAALLFGLADGLVAARVRSPEGLSAWSGCLAAAVATYARVTVPAGLLAALVCRLVGARLANSRWGRGSLAAVTRSSATVVFGLGLFFELYWHTRSLIFPGASAVAPGRLAAALVLLVIGLGLAAVAVRGVLRVGWLTRALSIAALAAIAGGGLYARGGGLDDRRGVVTDRNRDLPNILLIVVDALRHDVLGPYGSTHVQTPVIDALSRRGVVLENLRVQAPYTWTSFGSILTGKYPRRHGLVKMAPGVRMRPNVTLAWHLKQARFIDPTRGRLEPDDYVGATFMTGALSNGSGLMRGFDFYFEAMNGRSLADNEDFWSVFRSDLLLSLVHNKLLQRFQESPVNSAARAWLDDYGDRRFCAMLHYYSTHTPYAPPARFRERYCDPGYTGPFADGFWSWHREAIERGEYEPTPADKQQIRDLYYAGTAQADELIGEVLEDLEARGVLDETLVIVTSDHGEELGEHGVWEHNFMYRTNLQIPMILAGPGLPEGRRVAALTESVDLVPTLCELLGLLPPGPDPAAEPGSEEAIYERIDGISLAPLMRGEADWVKDFSFAENGRFVSAESADFKLIVRHEGLVAEGWQRILAGEVDGPRLFELGTDPGEFQNRFDGEPEDARAMYDVLSGYNGQMPRPLAIFDASQRDIDDELRRLRELGYVNGVGQEFEDRSQQATDKQRAEGSSQRAPDGPVGSGGAPE